MTDFDLLLRALPSLVHSAVSGLLHLDLSLLHVYTLNVHSRRFAMITVPVTTFRKHIPDYLGKVQKGEDISLTSRGKVVARLVPPLDERQSAQEQLAALRGKAIFIGDITSPLDVEWEVDRADP